MNVNNLLSFLGIFVLFNTVYLSCGMLFPTPKLSPGSTARSILQTTINSDETFGHLKKKLETMQQTDEHDIVFLVDVSYSVGKKNFRFEIKFIRKILSGFKISRNCTRVAIVPFSYSITQVRLYIFFVTLIGTIIFG